jgi:hypothetical protein
LKAGAWRMTLNQIQTHPLMFNGSAPKSDARQ